MRDKRHHHHHAKPLADGDTPPLIDPVRRQLVAGLGLLPLATLLPGARPAWALQNSVQITVSGGVRTVKSNAVPDHPTGAFPNRGNPHAISAQDLTFTMPETPRRGGIYKIAQRWNFGVAVNGVPFDPFTAEFWNRDRNWNYDAISGFTDLGLDDNNAHVQPGGKYHYHGWPTGLIRGWSPNTHSPIVGWAADGFPIYAGYGYSDPKDGNSPIAKMTSGFRVKQGRRDGGPGGSYDGRYFQDWDWQPGRGTLDQANGRETVTPDFPNGTYAYFLTEEWPVIPRYFAGIPDLSFRIGPPGGRSGPGGPGPGGRPPPGHRPPGGRPPPRRHGEDWPPRP